MVKTLYITDLDGTLLADDAKISPYGAETLNRLIENGVLFTYATARSIYSAKSITGCLNIKLPIAAHNGALLVDHGDRSIIDACVLDRESLRPVIGLIKREGLCPIIYSLIGGRERFSWFVGMESKGIAEFLESRENDERRRPVHSWEELFAGDVYYITFVGGYAEMEPLYPRLSGDSGFSVVMQEDTYQKGDYFLELARHDAKKDVAMRKIMRIAQAEKAVAFGDNINDIPMLRSADLSYAVSNGAAEAKIAATGVIGSNMSDGVVKKILELEQITVSNYSYNT